MVAMENKYMKYGLIVVVIVVWGSIIFRVVGGISGPDVPVSAGRPRPKVEAPVSREQYVLFADYPDPFVPEEDSLDAVETRKPGGQAAPYTASAPPVAVAPKPAPPPTLQSFLQYMGMIGNPEKKLKIAIINLHGKELLVREKEKHDEVLIKKIDRDKIGVVYKGKYVEVEKGN
jgi:hypothetical protein